jgi:hypothetical protein
VQSKNIVIFLHAGAGKVSAQILARVIEKMNLYPGILKDRVIAVLHLF